MSNDDIVKLKSELSDHQMAVLQSEMEKHRKSAGWAYVLFFFLGTLGIHKFYIGKTGWGVAYLILGIVGWFSMFLFIGLSSDSERGMGAGIIAIIFLSVLAVLFLIDLFTIPRQIRKTYEEIEIRIANKLKD